MSDGMNWDKDDFLGRFYFDVKGWGGLGELLQFHLGEIGSSLKVFTDRDALKGDTASCGPASRNSSRRGHLSVASEKRQFLVKFWDGPFRGMGVGRGSADSPREMAQMLEAWVEQQVTAREMMERFEEVQFREDADAYTMGAALYVRAKWKELRRRIREDAQLRDLAPVVEIAHSHPKLGKLLPFTSVFRLGFSQCTGYRFAEPCPRVAQQKRGQDEELQYAAENERGEIIMRGTAAEIVDYLASCLPSDCGPAELGTAEKFGPFFLDDDENDG